MKKTLKRQHLLVNAKEIKELNAILNKLYGHQQLSRWVRSEIRKAISTFNKTGNINIED